MRKTDALPFVLWSSFSLVAAGFHIGYPHFDAPTFRSTIKWRREYSTRQLHSTIPTPNTQSEGATSSPSEQNRKSSRYVAVVALMENKEDIFPLRRLENDVNYNGNMDIRDKRFTRALVSTVERRKGQIDKILDHCMDTKLKKAVSRELKRKCH
jgi:hypothetical protein